MRSDRAEKTLIMRGVVEAAPCPDGYPEGTACPSCIADSVLAALHNHDKKDSTP